VGEPGPAEAGEALMNWAAFAAIGLMCLIIGLCWDEVSEAGEGIGRCLSERAMARLRQREAMAELWLRMALSYHHRPGRNLSRSAARYVARYPGRYPLLNEQLAAGCTWCGSKRCDGTWCQVY
jgi:hypothetical protein